MIKEIYEQPKAIRETMTSRLAKDNSHVTFEELKWSKDEMAAIRKWLLLPAVRPIMQGLLVNIILKV